MPGDPARVIFRALHAVVDARGLIQFIMDVFRILRNEPTVGSMDSTTDLDVRLRHQDSVNVEKQDPITCIPAMPPAETPPPELNYVWRRVKIERNLPNMLPKMAIFLAKKAREHNEGDVAFTVPVDFRGLRCDVTSTANLTGYLKIHVKPEDKPRDVMRRVNQEVRDYGDCFNPSFVKFVPWLPIRFMQKQLLKDVDKLLYTPNEGLPSGGIVSLGHFKTELWSCPSFKAESIVGIPGSVGKLNVLIHNYSDNTQIVFSTPEAFNTEGQLDKLIHEFLNEFSPKEELENTKERKNINTDEGAIA